jgi:DNA repair protein RadD
MIVDRAYQTEAVGSLYQYFSAKSGHPVIAMPTASGKSIVIARFIQSVLQQWPFQQIIIATHVKELIDQNYKKMLIAWPNCPAGIYSAGLNQRDIHLPVIFGGIQSMVKKVASFGHRDLLLVDECHLISGKEDSNYGKFIAGLKLVNPNLRVIGFSATPYRMGSGLLSDGPIFTDICFDLTSMEAFNRLIDEGYLCPLIPKRTKTELNVSDIKIQAGDYIQKDLQQAVDKDAITYAACKEIVQQGNDRLSMLIFASGIEHAEHIAGMMQHFGIDAVAVHSRMEGRDKILEDFKSFKLRCVVNYGILTTGFDHPGLDLIAMLRPTASTALWVQMLGRGTRPCEETGKRNCLVLDFAGNTKRLGPINDPVIPKKKGSRDGVAPVKICKHCDAYNHARAVICCCCGMKFEFAEKIVKFADTSELIRRAGKEPETTIETYNVSRAFYFRHQKAGSPPILKVSYVCGLKTYNEYICFEHVGTPRTRAHNWWKQRLFGDPPSTVDEALKHIATLKVPRQIRVWDKGKYKEIVATIF